MNANFSRSMSLLDSLRAHPLPKELSFDAREYLARLERVRGAMGSRGLDALVVSNTANISWLTGYDTMMPSGPTTAIVTPHGPIVIVCPDLELACVLLHTSVVDIHAASWQEDRDFGDILGDVLSDVVSGGARVGVELARVDAYASAGLDAATYLSLVRSLPRVEWEDAAHLVSTERRCKSPAEIDAMRTAGRFTDIGLTAAINAIAEGATDADVMAACYQATIAAGSGAMSIDPMIVSGDHGGYMPFIPYRSAPYQAGDSVYLESSGSHKRYAAPLMRTASVGYATPATASLTALAAETVERLMQAIRPGRTGGDIADEVAPVLKDLSPDTFFAGTFGYTCGLGIQPTWTESPFYLAQGSEDVLVPHMTLHLPICLWSPQERTGVGVSETVLVTDTGCELITPGTGRDLVIR